MTRQENAIALLRATAAPFYMVQVHESRSGSTRHYRIFAIVQGKTIEDITAFVAHVCGSGWDAIRGTYNTTRGCLRHTDGPYMQSYLRQRLERPNLEVIIL